MKRISGIILILIVLAAFTPLGCFAVDVTCTNDAELKLTGGEGNDYTTYTLGDGCDGVTIRSIIISKNVSLDLTGKNLTANAVKCPDNTSQCSLEIIGPGTLTVSGSIEINNDLTISGGDVTANGNNRAIVAGYDFTIRGGEVTAPNYGIGAGHEFTILDGRVKAGISSSGTINIEGGIVEATNYGKFSGSISASNNITISGEDTQVTATATGTNFAQAIYSEGSITITDGTVTATADGNAGYCIAANNDITIKGGIVTASGGTAIHTSKGDINISGGEVTATGNNEGIGSLSGSITISGGEVTATGNNEGIGSLSGSITISGGEVTTTKSIHCWKNITISGGQVSASSIEARAQSIKLGWTESTDFIHADTYSAGQGIEALKPFRVFATDQITGEPEKTIEAGNVDANEINGKWLRNQAMELPVEISVVQGNGEKGVPDDVKARTIRLTIRLKQNGELKLSSAPIELAVTPGGNREPAEFDAVTFMPDTPDFQETCGNYEYEVLVTPKEVKADIAGAGDDGPAWLLRAAAGSPDCEKFVLTLYWDSKTAAPAPEVIRVVALPEDEIGAYQLRADGTKEYLLFQTYDICMTYLGRDELCRGPERCYHK